MQNIKELANIMGVSEDDLLCLAKSTAYDLAKDGLSSTKSVDHVMAYAANANKKFQAFATKYMTNSEAREAFQLTVYAEVAA